MALSTRMTDREARRRSAPHPRSSSEPTQPRMEPATTQAEPTNELSTSSLSLTHEGGSSPGTSAMATSSATPTGGPEYYKWRRAQWLIPAATTSSASIQESSGSDTKVEDNRLKLEDVLNQPGAEEDAELWKRYLSTVYSGLIGGKRFKKGVRLDIAVSLFTRRPPVLFEVTRHPTNSTETHLPSLGQSTQGRLAPRWDMGCRSGSVASTFLCGDDDSGVSRSV